MAERDEFLEFRRGDDKCHAALAQVADEAQDLGMGADIDPARRFVEKQHAGPDGQ